MGLFQDVTLTWKGDNYTVPADRMMMLIAEIEDALSGESGPQAIYLLMRPQGPPTARLASAFGAALRFAGSDVTDAEIYLDMMGGFAEGSPESVLQIQAHVLGLLQIIAPPVHEQLMASGSPEKVRPTAGESSEVSTT